MKLLWNGNWKINIMKWERFIYMLHYYYKNTIKNIWLYDEIPQFLFAELNIPAKNKGID